MTKPYDALLALLNSRHSCRAFRPDPVPHHLIEQIVSAAGRVPSWCNAQPWQVVITSGAATEKFRTALMETAKTAPPEPDMDWPQRYSGVYQSRRRACGFQLYDAVGISKTDRSATTAQMMENYRLFGAPHVAIVTSDADLGPYGAMDTGGFVATFTLAAEALGVASIPQAAVAAFGPMVRAHFDIPNNRRILCAISFGFEDTDHPANSFRTSRAPLNEVIDWHTKG
jgi:nitroreductase